MIKDINISNKNDLNSFTNHPLQSFEWGEFRKKTGVKVIRIGLYNKDKVVSAFQLTIHKIPHTPWTIGYLPKTFLPDKEVISELKKIGRQEKCIFIQLEPDVVKNQVPNWKLEPAAHPLFTRYTFILDLTKNEQELLAGMRPKTRYNIKVAQKNGVKIEEDNSDEAFNEYYRLTEETTKRQKFYAHSQTYHRLMWESLHYTQGERSEDKLTAHLFLAKYKPESSLKEKILAAWILFVFKDKLYYPYGSSSTDYREVMASNLIMWEAIKFGKKLGLKEFDMWGALGPNPKEDDSWYGFHRFKQGYGGNLIEFSGSFDLIINPVLYESYKILDKIRWIFLKIKR